MRTVPECQFEYDVMEPVLARQPGEKEEWLGGTVEALVVVFRGGLPHPYYRVRTISHNQYVSGGKQESVVDYPAGEVKARPSAPMLAPAK